MTPGIKERLEHLRGELRAERISYGEIAELQGLAKHIPADDVELREAAGLPEILEDKAAYSKTPIQHYGPVRVGDGDSHVAKINGNWVCLCGNIAELSGFHPVDREGNGCEPIEGWCGRYLCDKCGLIIEGDTGVVIDKIWSIADAEDLGYHEAKEQLILSGTFSSGRTWANRPEFNEAYDRGVNRAEKECEPKQFLAIHVHEYGTSVYPFKTRFLTNHEECAIHHELLSAGLGISFEPDKGETLEAVKFPNTDNIPLLK